MALSSKKHATIQKKSFGYQKWMWDEIYVLFSRLGTLFTARAQCLRSVFYSFSEMYLQTIPSAKLKVI